MSKPVCQPVKVKKVIVSDNFLILLLSFCLFLSGFLFLQKISSSYVFFTFIPKTVISTKSELINLIVNFSNELAPSDKTGEIKKKKGENSSALFHCLAWIFSYIFGKIPRTHFEEKIEKVEGELTVNQLEGQT